MSEEKKQEILDELKDALADVPEKYHSEVCASLTHDIGVIKRTINMVESQTAEKQAGQSPESTSGESG